MGDNCKIRNDSARARTRAKKIGRSDVREEIQADRDRKDGEKERLRGGVGGTECKKICNQIFYFRSSECLGGRMGARRDFQSGGAEGRGWGGSDSRGPHNKQNQLIYVLGVPRLVEGDYYRVP